MIRQNLYTGSKQAGLIAHALRFTRFGVVGGVGAVVNMAILYLLVHYGGWNHMAAAVVATETAILSNFAMNDRWTFRDSLSSISWSGRLVRYNAIACGGAAISLGVLAALTLGAGMHYLAANVVAIGAGTIWNYVVNSRVTWNLTHLGAGHQMAVDEPLEHVEANAVSAAD
ncbi:MAG: dolichyl-phosphate beta-D-mannosyltransferase [Chloroflexi bacterium]|jgi:dolichol-phosphate mannosyltransferase|nr:dolichyl-phosphate beta-D-mannosyltransferase [Chloroflexota bacterium]